MTITIKHGVNNLSVELAGQTVEEIRTKVEDVLNLGANEEARVNGSPATDETVVTEGQTLEFVKAAGEKGIAA